LSRDEAGGCVLRAAAPENGNFRRVCPGIGRQLFTLKIKAAVLFFIRKKAHAGRLSPRGEKFCQKQQNTQVKNLGGRNQWRKRTKSGYG